jgi:UDP-glucuronate 4-epimerase
MKIIVTGGAGFIGSSLSKYLAMMGHEVLALDSITSYYSQSLKEQRVESILRPADVSFQKLALEDDFGFQKVISKFAPETVIHLAAQPGVRIPLASSAIYVRDNLDAFSNVLINVIRNEVPNFLFASSSSVYGNNSRIPYSEDEPGLSPVSFYGATKLCNEILCRSLIPRTKTRARGLRFFTVYGPWGRPDMAYFRLAGHKLGKSKFVLNGDGSTLRDFTYIDDVTRMIEGMMAEMSQRNSGFFDITNIGGGQPRSMDELIGLVLGEGNSSQSLSKQSSNPLDVNATVSDVTYQKSLIATIPTISLENGISNFMEWVNSELVLENIGMWIDSVNP